MHANTNAGRISTETLGGAAYDRLWEDIVAGRYEPETKLRIDALCKAYNIGASPVREALARLSECGFVVASPQRGYWVAPVSLEEYRDLCDQRVSLEVPALIDSIEHGDVAWESTVVASYHRLARAHANLVDGSEESFMAWTREDRAFHLSTIAKCSSVWLKRFCETILNQLARYHRQRYLGGIVPGDQNDKEHLRFMRAVVERDKEKAPALLAKHIRAAARRLSGDQLPEAQVRED
jgi:DNA-binding GntR family transcriptional regulator